MHFCCGLALSLKPKVRTFDVVVWQTTSTNCAKKRAARVARLFIPNSTNQIMDFASSIQRTTNETEKSGKTINTKFRMKRRKFQNKWNVSAIEQFNGYRIFLDFPVFCVNETWTEYRYFAKFQWTLLAVLFCLFVFYLDYLTTLMKFDVLSRSEGWMQSWTLVNTNPILRQFIVLISPFITPYQSRGSSHRNCFRALLSFIIMA